MPSRPLPSELSVNDAELAHRIACNDEAAFEAVMRHHNGGLFRVARAILKNNADAEDVLQEAYLAAYRHIGDFRADAKLSTWLTRIVINQARARLRSRHRARIVVPFSDLSAKERIRSEREKVRRIRVVAGAIGDAGRHPAPARAKDRRAARRLSHCVCFARSRGPISRRDRGVLVDPGSDRAVAHVPRTGDAARVASARARHGNRRRLPLWRRALRLRRR